MTMDDRLDLLLQRLAASATDRSLDGFDAELDRGMARWRARAQAASALAPVRVASIALALAMGLTVGGLTAAMSIAAPHASSGFSAAADLAPSTLLDGDR